MRSVKRHLGPLPNPWVGTGPRTPASVPLSLSLSGLTGSAHPGLLSPQSCRAWRAVGFTMLAPGGGPEQRTRLALQWRQVSCEYAPGHRARAQSGGLRLSTEPRETSEAAGRLQTCLPRMPKALHWETRPRPVIMASGEVKERATAESFGGWTRSRRP